MRVLIVGAGLIGAHHALAAAMAGHTVTMLDRHAVPRGASSRNLGAIRLSGRASGLSLEMSRFGLTRWRAIAERVPEIGFSQCGSITLLRTDIEIAVAEEYVDRYRDSIDLEVVPGSRIPSLEPAITGVFPAALVCGDDATIAPGVAMPALIDYLRSAEGVDIRLGVEVRDLTWRGRELLASTTAADVARRRRRRMHRRRHGCALQVDPRHCATAQGAYQRLRGRPSWDATVGDHHRRLGVPHSRRIPGNAVRT